MTAILNTFALDLKPYFERCKLGLKKQSGEVLALRVGLGSLTIEETTSHFVIKNTHSIHFPYALVDLADDNNKVSKFVLYNEENQAIIEIDASPPFILLSGDKLIIPEGSFKILIDRDGV